MQLLSGYLGEAFGTMKKLKKKEKCDDYNYLKVMENFLVEWL